MPEAPPALLPADCLNRAGVDGLLDGVLIVALRVHDHGDSVIVHLECVRRNVHAERAAGAQIGVNNWLGWRSIIIAHDYIAFVTSMMIIFGLAFQTPIAVLLLAKTGLVKAESFAAHRRCVIFSIAALCAIATPSASPIDMLVLALPVWLLYELGVLLARQFATRRN